MNPELRISHGNNKSFTLIELLVVLALVAILSVVVVMTLNPAELIKQARDSNRLSDLSTINTALNLFSTDVTSGFMGTSTVVYVSIPSTLSDCSNLGLPTLPSTYTYNCVTTTNLRNTNGTGWIPVNFQRISSNSPISQLPIDPQNTTSTKYYTYVTGGSWKLTATPESQKYLTTAANDGGAGIGQFETGTNLDLAPFIDGLVGWWKFDEGSGATANDSSGFGNSGTLYNSPTWSSGKIGSSLTFNNNNTYIQLATSSQIRVKSKTISFWANPTGIQTYNMILGNASGNYYITFTNPNNISAMHASYSNGAGAQISNAIATGVGIISTSTWGYYSFVFDVRDPNVIIQVYRDGQLAGTQSRTDGYSSTITTNFYLGAFNVAQYVFNGALDDIRFYNRALSAAEILALYNSTK